MNKSQLIQILRDNRQEFDKSLRQVPEAFLDNHIVSGSWSVKHIVSHLNYYEEWYANRLEEIANGKDYISTEYDGMHWQKRNIIIHEQTKDIPVDVVMAKSRAGFERLLAAVTATPEQILIEPQELGGPHPLIIWQVLRGDVYDHYLAHVKIIRNWVNTQFS